MIYIKYKIIIIIFFRVYLKKCSCTKYSYNVSEIYFYSSVHFCIDSWICREVLKWIRCKVHSQDHGTRNTSLA